MKKRYLHILCLALIGITSAQATHFTYSANIANNLVGLNGQALAATDTVEIGTYLNGTFTSIHSGVSTNQDIDGGGFDAGFFAYTGIAIDTENMIGDQLAIRWNHAVSGTWAILYVDITTVGLDATIRDQWTVKGGDGSEGDQNII